MGFFSLLSFLHSVLSLEKPSLKAVFGKEKQTDAQTNKQKNLNTTTTKGGERNINGGKGCRGNALGGRQTTYQVFWGKETGWARNRSIVRPTRENCHRGLTALTLSSFLLASKAALGSGAQSLSLSLPLIWSKLGAACGKTPASLPLHHSALPECESVKKQRGRKPVVKHSYTRLYSFKFSCKIVSFTAANTNLMFSVSVAHVKWE